MITYLRNLQLLQGRSLKVSLSVYLVILVFLLLTVWQSDILLASGKSVRTVGWDIVLLWVIGLVCLLLQKTAGFPQIVDVSVKRKWRYAIPLITGVLFAIPDVVIIAILQQEMHYTELPPYTQPFPYSVFLYYSGAFWVDAICKLLPLTLVMLMCFRANDKTRDIVFWVTAVLLALIEPLEQFPSGNAFFVIYSVSSCFAFNLLALWYYRRAGWMAALLVRIGHYTVWHILLGVYIEFVVLG